MKEYDKKSVGAQMDRGRNMHYKSLGSEKRKKNFILSSVTLLSLLALLASVAIAPAIASDWCQFQ